ncbi:MAG: NADH-quinone oxidoreductase subunit E [Ignavibacteria bacterium]|nr:NADH-quinone oxidoreductase subunit E [Ignavibacteria bacterium]
MTDKDKKIKTEFIASLVRLYGKDRSSLLPVLQEFQKKFRYIDEYSQQEIADALSIHPVEVNSIISFYAFLYDKPRGKHTIRICKNIVCKFHGNKELSKFMEKKVSEFNKDKSEESKITIEYVNCIGLCDRSPSMLVDEKVYEKINPHNAEAILEELS